MRTLIVGNGGDADDGLVGQRLAEHGSSFERAAREYPREWPSLGGVDVVVLLGSDWSVYWESNAVEVEAEADLVRTARRRGVPIFGICFGAQIVAHSLGGHVERAPRHEIGWHHVGQFTGELASEHVLAGPWMQWHYDRFTAPPGMSTLAMNDVGVQAMYGDRTLATQFHPEVTPAIVQRWATVGGRELEAAGVDPKHLCEITVAQVIERGDATARLVDWFLEKAAS
jgi:GMP synthase-like glutamine amidotransferase